MIPQAKNMELDPFIDNSTTFLKEIDPLFKHCFETGSDFQKGAVDYEKAFSDMYYLVLNALYHTESIYESAINV